MNNPGDVERTEKTCFMNSQFESINVVSRKYFDLVLGRDGTRDRLICDSSYTKKKKILHVTIRKYDTQE